MSNPSVSQLDWQSAIPWDLEPYYTMWVRSLTMQGLHAKADIATVLALFERKLAERDATIAELRTVECEQCAFRYGSEHTMADGSYQCPVCELKKAETALAAAQTDIAVIYNGHAVYTELTDLERSYTSPNNVSAVLDAVARIWKRKPAEAK